MYTYNTTWHILVLRPGPVWFPTLPVLQRRGREPHLPGLIYTLLYNVGPLQLHTLECIIVSLGVSLSPNHSLLYGEETEWERG